jgi:hypothetical protein
MTFGRQQRLPRQDTRSRRNAARMAQAGQLGDGLVANALGQMSIGLSATPGLEFDGGLIQVKVAAPITRTGDGVGLSFGTGLQNDGGTLKTKDSEIVHDNLSGFVADEHVAHSGVSITAGTGMTGGGDITTTRTLGIDRTVTDLWYAAAGAHAATHEVGGDDLVSHDSLTDFVANEHIDWTNAVENFGTTGSMSVGATAIFNAGYTDTDFVIRKNTAGLAYVYDGGADTHSFSGTVNLATCVNAGVDTDKFLVLDAGGNVDYRTGAEVINDGGGLTSANIIPQEVPETGSIRLGLGGGGSIASATGATILGYYAGEKLEDGIACTYVGEFAGRFQVDGNYNTFVGGSAGSGSSGVSIDCKENSSLGYASLYSLTTGDYNTAVGRAAGYGLTTGSSNVCLGYYAGRNQTTNSNLLIVDNQDRGDAATELTNAILYGVMAAAPASQTLRINTGNITTTGHFRFDSDSSHLYMGGDDDLSISHDGANASIATTTGELQLGGTGAGIVLEDTQITIGDGVDDVVVTFAGGAASGIFRWLEDEDYFQVDDDVRFTDRYVGHTTSQATTGAAIDNVDVATINVLFVDTSIGDVTIGGFVGGVNGQHLSVVVSDATNNATLEHAEGTGNQDIYLESGGDETKTATYGGWTLVCDGSNWYQVK